VISKAPDVRRRTRRIAIVGGGPGGLLTAYFAERAAVAPESITLYEAGPRLGGKVHSASFAAAPVRYEAGAAELYDYSVIDDDPLRDLVAALGLATVPMEGAAVFLDDGPVANLDDVHDRLGDHALAALAAFDNAARNGMSRREFYAADTTDAADPVASRRFDAVLDRIRVPAARRYVETMIHSDLASEPDRTRSGYGLQNYLMNDPAYMRLYCIAGGNERLIDALAARISARIRRGEPVAAIDRAWDGRLRVVSHRAGLPQGEDYDCVVLALPLDQLRRIGSGDEAIAAALRGHCARHDHPAHYLRVSVLFERPFWRHVLHDSFVMLDRFGGCCLYDESSREAEPTHGVLGWLLGGNAAEELAALPDEEIVRRVLDALPPGLEDAGRHVLEARVHRWTSAVSALPGGWPPRPVDERHRPDPAAHPHLFVVGDYLFDSTINGVLDSATHVAGWLAAVAADEMEEPT
jgi:protoporphyrinogen oxidase